MVRIETDSIGEISIDNTAWYGIQTKRALKNFNITGVPISHFPKLISALTMVKMAAANANNELGLIPPEKAGAIITACKDIINGEYHQEFVVDVIQGGAGTSTNMNANEVIANIALEKLGHEKGNYQYLHPNNDVNRSQSTNDVYPTAARLAIVFYSKSLIAAMNQLIDSLHKKGDEFSDVMKMGRTQLQDAVPMTLGQEFKAYAVNLAEDIHRLNEVSALLCEVNLGGTAIGTGINSHPNYSATVVKHLADISGLPIKLADNLIEASSDMGAFVMFSSVLKRFAIKLSKMSNDLRLLSSGPRAGLNEINLPAVQAGSSIMPGKVNPVIPEAVNQTAFQVIGGDLAITMAAEAGQMQLNAMEPLIVYNLLNSINMLISSICMLDERCIRGITANRDQCNFYVENSIGVITALVPELGYDNAARIAKKALKENTSVKHQILAEGLLDETTLDTLLSPEAMLNP